LWLTGVYGFGLWLLPALIKQLSATGIGNVSVLTAIPFAFAALGLFVNTRAGNWHFIVPLVIGGVAILLQPADSRPPCRVDARHGTRTSYNVG